MHYSNQFRVVLVVFLLAYTTKGDSIENIAPPIKNGAALLAKVNALMKEWHKPPFSKNELLVCLTEQAFLMKHDGDIPPNVQSFLEQLRTNKPFDLPIELMVLYNRSVGLGKGASQFDAQKQPLRYPAHWAAVIDILDMPRGTKDEDGIEKKLSIDEIPFAYHLDSARD